MSASASPSAHAAFALALLGLDGVGRVTANRLLEHFLSLDALHDHPREQVLIRLKSAPRAEATVERLFDRGMMEEAVASARAEIAAMAERHVAVLAPGDALWPGRLAALAPAERPVVLYTFGTTEALAMAPTAFFAPSRLSPTPFEQAQALAHRLLDAGLPLACGVPGGLDVVLQKLTTAAAQPCVIVAHTGLARIAQHARPSVAATVKAGGVLVSPFPPTHGPFDHDDTERARLQAALAGPCVFVEPEADAPERRALDWALNADRPVFAATTSESDGLPERVHRLDRPVDLDWVVAAAQNTDAP